MDKMTGAELYAYVLAIFKRTDKETEAYQAISDTLMDIKLAIMPDDVKVEAYATGITTLGDYTMGLPSDFGHLIGDVRFLDDDSSYTLTKLSKGHFDRLYPNPNYDDVNMARPQHFCIYRKQIHVCPVPDSISYQYEFNYTEEAATEIASDTEDILFTDRYRTTVRYGVLFHLFDLVDQNERAMKYKLLFDDGVRKIAARDNDNARAPIVQEYSGF